MWPEYQQDRSLFLLCCAAYLREVYPAGSRHSRQEIVITNNRKGWTSWIRDKQISP